MSVNNYDADLYDAIEDLVAYGIAQQVIHNGYNSLTQRQRTLYNAVVIPALHRRGAELQVIQIMNSAAA